MNLILEMSMISEIISQEMVIRSAKVILKSFMVF